MVILGPPSLGKILKKNYQFFINYVLLKNVKCKVVFSEAYLKPHWISTMELLCM